MIAEITTDKIDTEIPAPAAGRLQEMLVEPGETVDVGAPLALDRDRCQARARPTPRRATSRADEPGRPRSDARWRGRRARGRYGGRAHRYGAGGLRRAAKRAASATRRLSSGSRPTRHRPRRGRGDRPRRARAQAGRARVPRERRGPAERSADAHRVPLPARRAAARRTSASRASAEPTRDLPAPAAGAAPLSRMRQSIGGAWSSRSSTAATCTTWIEADMGRVERAREQLGLTVLPIVGRAMVETLREHPPLNAWLEGDRHTTLRRAVHLGIAVSLGDGGPHRPGDPRRAGPLRRGPRGTHP